MTSGPRAAELERRFAEHTGARHALAVSSGTAAMHLALVAAGIGPGDEVITSPITWPATANVIVHTGACPVFCDVRESDLNLDPALLPGWRPSAPGRSCRWTSPASRDLRPDPRACPRAAGLSEDRRSRGRGAEYRGRPVGSSPIDMLLCTRPRTSRPAREEWSRPTGTTSPRRRELRLMRRGHGSLYDIRHAGFKANLADVNAAIARSARSWDATHDPIRHVAAYEAALTELDGIDPLGRDPGTRTRTICVVRIDAERAGGVRDEYQQALAAENIGTSIHFLPVHRLTYYRERFPDRRGALPVAERAGPRCCRCRCRLRTRRRRPGRHRRVAPGARFTGQ